MYNRYCPICKSEVIRTERTMNDANESCCNNHQFKRSETLNSDGIVYSAELAKKEDKPNTLLQNITNVGKSATNVLKNTGVTDTAINMGLTSVIGPLGKPVNDTFKVSEGVDKKTKNWFDDLSAENQKKYADKHKESEVVKEAKKRGKLKQLKPKIDKPIKEAKEKVIKPKKEKIVKPKTAEEKQELLQTKKPAKENFNVRKLERQKRHKVKPRHEYRKGNIRGVPSISGLETAAKIDSEKLNNALKCMYLIMYYSTEGSDNLPKDIVSVSKSQWQPDLVEFLDAYKVPKLAIVKLLNAAYTHEAFNSKIDDLITKSGLALKSKKEAFDKDVSINKIELGMLKAFTSYFTRNSETALNYLEKNISSLKEPKINLIFAKAFTQKDSITPSAQTGVKELLQNLVKKATGKIGDTLTAEQLLLLKGSNPQLFTQYNQLRRSLNTIYKDWIRNYVRQSGKDKVNYAELYKAINKAGIENNLSPNFVGYIDDQLNYYTQSGKLVDGKPVGVITMNPSYSPEEDNSYVFKLKTPMGESVYYTVDYKSAKVNKKFDTVNKLEDNIVAIRKKWLNDLRSESKNQLLAAQLELMYKFAARSGRSGNETSGEATYGITTLLVSHISRQGNGFKISYKGKKGAAQIHMLNSSTPNDRFLIKVIENLLEGKKRNEPLWTYNGKEIQATSTMRYLKSISGMADVKLHYVRHLMGNKLARDILKKSPLKKGVSQAKAESWFKEAMKEVGEALAHSTAGKITGITAIKSYISPTLQKEFFTGLGLRTPSFIPKEA